MEIDKLARRLVRANKHELADAIKRIDALEAREKTRLAMDVGIKKYLTTQNLVNFKRKLHDIEDYA